jgi:hypothetical protein
MKERGVAADSGRTLPVTIMAILEVALLGLFTTRSVLIGAALALYLPISNTLHASILAFAAAR